MKRLLCAVSVSALLLAGCGAKDAGQASETPSAPQQTAQVGTLDDIDVTGDVGKKPEVKFPAPFAMNDTAHKVLDPGNGATADTGMQVTANYTLVSGQTGDVIESSYDTGQPSGFPLDDTQINKDLYDSIMGAKEGGRVLMAVNGSPATGQPEQTLVYVWDIVKVEKLPEPLTRATGTEKQVPDSLPQVTRDSSGKPSVSAPTGDAPTELTATPTIEGDGAEVKEGQKITVHYTGWLWDDTSKPFDSSWDRGQSASFTLAKGQVIDGWVEGLVGQKVGSQVLLVVPPDKGYGAAGSPPSIPGNATLIFVVDILATVG